MLHLGLLITKDDDEIIGPWFGENARYFDEVVCLDGSESDVTKTAALAEPNVVYVHDRDRPNLIRTDHGLRELAHRVLLDRYGGLRNRLAMPFLVEIRFYGSHKTGEIGSRHEL